MLLLRDTCQKEPALAKSVCLWDDPGLLETTEARTILKTGSHASHLGWTICQHRWSKWARDG